MGERAGDVALVDVRRAQLDVATVGLAGTIV